ncbi:hypothetical protein BYT27DRAFT_6564497 [Phlegmacium glaucopus]|nr:hypothetical protein BYT27DRAFT_6564497 [Phlegmacium glaucopus]
MARQSGLDDRPFFRLTRNWSTLQDFHSSSGISLFFGAVNSLTWIDLQRYSIHTVTPDVDRLKFLTKLYYANHLWYPLAMLLSLSFTFHPVLNFILNHAKLHTRAAYYTRLIQHTPHPKRKCYKKQHGDVETFRQFI